MAARKVSVPTQFSWMSHLGIDDSHRKPTPPQKPTPAQKGAQTRARNAGVARSQAVPDYEPHMQNTGGSASSRTNPLRPFDSSHIPSARTPGGPRRVPLPRVKNVPRLVNPPSVSRPAAGGVKVNAAVPKPPRIPGIPTGYVAELGTGAEKSGFRVVPRAAASGVTRGGAATAGSVLKGAGKLALRGALGTVGSVVAAGAFADKAEGSSGGAEKVLARTSPDMARQYVDHLSRGAKARGESSVEVDEDIYRLASTKDAPRLPSNGGISEGGATSASIAAANRSSRPKTAGPTYGGKFVRNAWEQNKKYSASRDQAVATSQQYSAAMDKFKQTHAWARGAKTAGQRRDLNQAVTYLANTRHKAYFTP